MLAKAGEDFGEVKKWKSGKVWLSFDNLTFSHFNFSTFSLFYFFTLSVSFSPAGLHCNFERRKIMKLMSKNDNQKTNRIINLMQRDNSVDAPADAIRWSKNIFRSRVVEPKKSLVERIFAVLQMDLSPNRAAFGERSASASQARQVFFKAGENALDIRISENALDFNLNGQILGEGYADCVVKFGAFETTANERGEFKLTNIPSGIYNLSVRIGEKEIVVEDLELKQV